MSTVASAVRFAKAVASNQLARLAPRLYLHVTGQTGRGSGSEQPEEVAAYFLGCVDDYFGRLGVEASGRSSFLAAKHIMEYGPGDLPGVALLLYALGAGRVTCVDRFPMMQLSPYNQAVLKRLMERLPAEARTRAERAFNRPADPGSGLRPGTVDYLVRPSGLSGLVNTVDLILSRAVLEHVDDLPATFADMARALKPGERAVHQVDLRSHGLHRATPLDFLCWSPTAWRLMYSAKGVPNRWRMNAYRDAIAASGLVCLELEPTERATADQVAAVRPRLPALFAGLGDEDLACLGFWVVLRKPARDKG